MGMQMILPALPEIILGAGALFLLMVSVMQKQVLDVTKGAILVLILASFSLMWGPKGSFYSGLFHITYFNLAIKLVLFVLTIILLLGSSSFMEKYKMNVGELPVLILLSLFGMAVMVSSYHFMTLYIGMEVTSLSLYTLACMEKRSIAGSEAAMKYFILGSLASVVFLYGVSLMYGMAGGLDFHTVTSFVSQHATEKMIFLSLVLIICAWLFKMGLVPFHVWVPDVYQGVPIILTAFIATVSKVAAFGVIAYLFANVLKSFVTYYPTVWEVIGVISVLFGAILPLRQSNLKRLLAYSSIGHAGLVFLCILAQSGSNIQAALCYLIIYGLNTIAVFLCLMSLEPTQEGEINNRNWELKSLAGLASYHPKHALCLGISFLSLGGLPPLLGFWGKFYIFQSLLDTGQMKLVLVGLVASVISIFYYLNLIKKMYIDPAEEEYKHAYKPMPTPLKVLFAILMFIQVFIPYIPMVQHSVLSSLQFLIV